MLAIDLTYIDLDMDNVVLKGWPGVLSSFKKGMKYMNI